MLLTLKQQNDIDASRFCIYCGAPVAGGAGWSAIGQCQEHRRIWEEDIKFGLWKRNRLKELQLKIELNI